MLAMTNVLIASNETIFAKGMEEILTAGGLVVSAVCHDVTQLFDSFIELRPDVVLLHPPILPDLHVIAELRRLGPKCQIILWPHGLSQQEKGQVLALGARAVLPVGMAAKRFVETVHLMAGFPEPESSPTSRMTQACDPLHREVLTLVGHGMSNEEIAAAIRSDAAAVATLVSTLSSRFGAQDRCELALYGLSALKDLSLTVPGETKPWKNEIAIV